MLCDQILATMQSIPINIKSNLHMGNLNLVYNWESKLAEIFIRTPDWGLSARTMNQNGGLVSERGGPGGVEKRRTFYMENIVPAMHGIWNKRDSACLEQDEKRSSSIQMSHQVHKEITNPFWSLFVPFHLFPSPSLHKNNLLEDLLSKRCKKFAIKNLFAELASYISLQKAKESDTKCYLGITGSNKVARTYASF